MNFKPLSFVLFMTFHGVTGQAKTPDCDSVTIAVNQKGTSTVESLLATLELVATPGFKLEKAIILAEFPSADQVQAQKLPSNSEGATPNKASSAQASQKNINKPLTLTLSFDPSQLPSHSMSDTEITAYRNQVYKALLAQAGTTLVCRPNAEGVHQESAEEAQEPAPVAGMGVRN